MNKVDAKVVMLGQAACGKTSLVERFIYNRFNPNYQATIGAAFGARLVSAGGRDICIGVWDTAGSERYEAMSRIYYRDAHAAVICYDITDIESLDRARFWVQRIQEDEERCKIYVCGTKLDLVHERPDVRAVDRHNVETYADEVGVRAFETSSKTGANIEEMFKDIAEDFVAAHPEVTSNAENSRIRITNEPNRKKCC